MVLQGTELIAKFKGIIDKIYKAVNNGKEIDKKFIKMFYVTDNIRTDTLARDLLCQEVMIGEKKHEYDLASIAKSEIGELKKIYFEGQPSKSQKLKLPNKGHNKRQN